MSLPLMHMVVSLNIIKFLLAWGEEHPSGKQEWKVIIIS